MVRFAWLLWLLAAVAGSTVSLSCGSSPPVDQNFGTEAGADFTPPDTGIDTGAVDGGNAADAGTDTGADSGGDV